MKFGPVPIESAEGQILGHNVAGSDGKRVLRKGRSLTLEDIQLLRGIGRQMVYVASLEEGDVEEDEAARRIVMAVAGAGIRLTAASAGRVNLLAEAPGVLRLDLTMLHQINSVEGVTLASRPANLPVSARQIAATLKVIPYGLPERVIQKIEELRQDNREAIWIDKLEPKRVGFIFSGSPEAQPRILNDFDAPLRERVEGLGSSVAVVQCIALEDERGEEALADLFASMARDQVDLIILAGETAIMDRHDIAPRAVERAGGRVECVGVPVDPGNLLMIAYQDRVPILGAPGCARSRKTNVIDWVLPRLLVGEILGKEDLIQMANGGLLEDTPLRPRPRSEGENRQDNE
jgi:molybdenum cofactor cytidylyltransferase